MQEVEEEEEMNYMHKYPKRRRLGGAPGQGEAATKWPKLLVGEAMGVILTHHWTVTFPERRHVLGSLCPTAGEAVMSVPWNNDGA